MKCVPYIFGDTLLTHISKADLYINLHLLVCLYEQVLNKLDEFEDAVRKAVKDVRLDNDVVVSVFETNIRVLGYIHYIIVCMYSITILELSECF